MFIKWRILIIKRKEERKGGRERGERGRKGEREGGKKGGLFKNTKLTANILSGNILRCEMDCVGGAVEHVWKISTSIIVEMSELAEYCKYVQSP